MPSSLQANGQKGDRLLSDLVLSRAEERIRSWWSQAYQDGRDPIIARRFSEEALATLPVDTASSSRPRSTHGLHDGEYGPGWRGEMPVPADSSAVFAAMRYQRLRLKQDQNLPEWGGIRR